MIIQRCHIFTSRKRKCGQKLVEDVERLTESDRLTYRWPLRPWRTFQEHSLKTNTNEHDEVPQESDCAQQYLSMHFEQLWLKELNTHKNIPQASIMVPPC